jgi:hypothetical protein
VDIVRELYYWTDHILWAGLIALRVWALVDCLTRKAAAFPAANKLTKPAWAAILLISGALGTLLGPPSTPSTVLSVFSLVSTVVSAIYLADVRPAVREISGGR